jgi:predicted site-specific integrase-resolvase
MNEKAFVSIREASSITGLEAQTLRKLADQQTLPCYKTPAGQRMFDRLGLEKMCHPTSTNTQVSKNKTNFVYTRVSSKKQMDDLSRQISYIKCQRPEYSSYTFVSDIASGINFKRKGLSTILDACLQGLVGDIVVAHRDRLSRFGFDLLELIVSKCGGKIVVLDNQGNRSSEQELSEDLLSIVHIYSCRQMGKRSYRSKCNQSVESKA